MRRRDFIAGILVSAAGSVRAQEKQQRHRLAIISVAMPVAEMSETATRPYYRTLLHRLHELGYVEGKNLSVERYSAEGRTERFAELVREVARTSPEVAFVSDKRLARDFKISAAALPLVEVGGDPVADGLVSSLARPGGNITGVSVDAGTEYWGKQLELLREMVPAVSRVGWLASRLVWEESTASTAIREAAQRLKFSLHGPPLEAPIQESEYRRVFSAMADKGVEAVVVGAQSENTTNQRLIVELVAKAQLPAIYTYREFAAIGGLMTYGINLSDIFRHAAEQIAMIFKGTRPGEIPIYQPTKFDLVINLKTASSLGLRISDSLIARADEVIE